MKTTVFLSTLLAISILQPTLIHAQRKVGGVLTAAESLKTALVTSEDPVKNCDVLGIPYPLNGQV